MKYLDRTLVIGLVCVSILSSCKKSYLETSPTDQVDAGTLTVTSATSTINGIHRTMFTRNDNQGEFGFGTIMLNNEVLGEDYVFSGQANGWWITFYRWLDHRNANSGNCEHPYQFFYKIITNANVIINGIDAASGLPSEKNPLKGQALTYRAWAHFYLVQLYGKRFDKTTPNSDPGVPLVLINTTDPQPRATVAEVYTQINKDLNNAETLLTTARANKSNFNLNVVRGLQARIALTQQNWDLAGSKAAAARAGFTLMTGTQQLQGFNNWDNPEWMWGSRQLDDQTEFFTAYLAYISCNYNSTNIRANPKLINSTLYNTMNPNDVRRALWRVAPTSTNVVTPPGGLRFPYMNQKFLAKDFANSVGDIPYMRVAEMYLIEAEAYARNGQEVQAKDALFTFQSTRVPGYIRSANTGNALLTEIMNTRRVELWGEGFRFLDLKRLNLPVDRNGANHNQALAVTMNIAVGALDWQYYIPQTEINSNKLVTQNQ